MGFRQAKSRLLAALRSGNFQHEVREVLAEKNLLAIDDDDWYIKCYFLPDSEDSAVFISVHT